MRIIYVLEYISTCGCGAVVTTAGNPADVSTLTAVCVDCGQPAEIRHSRKVGFSPEHPDFQAEITELTADFASLFYYLAIVDENSATYQRLARPEIDLQITFKSMFCETCQEEFDPQAADSRTKHGGHTVIVSCRVSTPAGESVATDVKQMAQQIIEKAVEECGIAAIPGTC